MLLLQLVILMVVIFSGLIFALRHLLTKNISSATTHLDTMNAEFGKRQDELKKRQAEVDKYYDEVMGKVKEETDKLKQEAGRLLREEKEKVLEQARLESEQIIAKAQKSKEALVDELRQEMGAKIIGRVGRILNDIFPGHVRSAVHKLWIEDLLAGDLSRLGAMHIPPELAEIKLVCAFALTPEQKEALARKFREQLNKDFVFHEETRPDLIAGVMVVAGHLVLDGTLADRIRQAVKDMPVED